MATTNANRLNKVFYLFLPVSLIFIGSMEYNSKKTRSKKIALQQQLEQLAETVEVEKKVAGEHKETLSHLLNMLDNDLVPSSESVEWTINKIREYCSETTLDIGYEYGGSSVPFGMNIPLELHNTSVVRYPLLAPCVIILRTKGPLPELARFFDRLDARGDAFIVEEFDLKSIETTNEYHVTARLVFPQFLYKSEYIKIRQFLNKDSAL